MTEDASARDAALNWLVWTNDPDFDRWDEFTAWLETSPENAEAFHSLAQSEIELRPFVQSVPSQLEQGTGRTRPPRLAVAASLAALLAIGTGILVPRITPRDYATRAGEMMTVKIGGGDQLVLNGDTRVSLSGWDRRTVKLAQGQVLLRLRDKSGGAVQVTSGDLRLVDVGTVFEVSRDGRETRVIVSEGAVVADPGGASLKIDAGERLDTSDGATVLRATPADVSAVGSFATGQLSYFAEPVPHVVADLRRSTGIDFQADGTITSKRFSGTLSLSAIRRNPESVGPLLGVSVERLPGGWKLSGKG
jgi:transmembrane sensor